MYNEQFVRAVLAERARERQALEHGPGRRERELSRIVRPALRVRSTRLAKLFGNRRPNPAPAEVTTRPA